MNIITLTLCPAFDIHCSTEQFAAFKENAVRITSRNAGGKGVNISRALCNAEVPNTAIVVVGEENGEEFLTEIASLDPSALKVEGRIRENITLHSDGGKETRISFPGFAVKEDFIDRLEQMFPSIAAGDIVTLTGRLPEGLSVEKISGFLEMIRCKGTLLVIDSNSFSLNDLIALRPWLIKPNEQEIAAFVGREVSTACQAIPVAEELHKAGIDNVMISLGDKGAVLVNERGAFVTEAPDVEVLSTIGAGDSSIAGFIVAQFLGERDQAALRRAVAFGSAACLTEGTAPPNKEDIDRLLALM